MYAIRSYYVREGTPLTVMTAVNPGEVFTAAITEIRPQVESANKGVVAYADLPDARLTRAGASAAVWATLAVHDNAMVVPQLSLVRRPAVARRPRASRAGARAWVV